MAKVLGSDKHSGTSVFAVPGFARIYSVGVVWSLCRWAIGFLGAYIVSDMTGSPRLVQLTGTLLWAPLLLAGVVGGAVSDRFPRRALMLAQFAILAPLTVLIGVLALTERLPLWLLYTYMGAAGFGWVLDMTVRRAMVYDLVGDDHIDRAMAFEGLASSLGLAVGVFAGGILIGTVGPGGAYLSVSAAIAVAAVLMLRVPAVGPSQTGNSRTGESPTGESPTGNSPIASVPGDKPLVTPQPSLSSEVVDGLRLVGRWPVLASVLGVTALTNFFHFSYFPMVAVIAEGIDASPAATGALAAATGLGMAVGSTIVLRFRPQRGRAYALGSAGAFVCLLGFAGFDRYWLVFASLLVASSFVGMFGATQSVLTMTSVGEQERGRAMGLLSMAIGMLPLGMVALGEVAELVGPRPALIASNLAGLAALGLFLRRRPQVLRVT